MCCQITVRSSSNPSIYNLTLIELEIRKTWGTTASQSDLGAQQYNGRDLPKALVGHMENKEVSSGNQYSFTKGKSSLTNCVAFNDGVAVSVGKGRAIDIIYLNLHKVTLSHMTPQPLNQKKKHLLDLIDEPLNGEGVGHMETCDEWNPLGINSGINTV